MSHFAVLVIGHDADRQLEPFDENLVCPMHVYETKQEIIERERNWRENYKNSTYAEYLKDKEAYKAKYGSPEHINYLENEFPKILSMTDEELYEKYISYKRIDIADAEEDGIPPSYAIDSKGNVLSTFNENAKWDWYVLGGRYCGKIIVKEGVEVEHIHPSWMDEKDKEMIEKAKKERRVDSALKKDIENLDNITCYALVKDYEWFEIGQMHWFGISDRQVEEDKWDEFVRKTLNELPEEELISVYDCHI